MRTKIYCACCGKPRDVNLAYQTMALATGAILLGHVCLAFYFGWVWLIVGLFVMTLGETWYRALRRKKLACPKCGFDPYMFKSDPEKMKQVIKSFGS